MKNDSADHRTKVEDLTPEQAKKKVVELEAELRRAKEEIGQSEQHTIPVG